MSMNIDPTKARFKISIDVDTEQARLEITEGEEGVPGYKYSALPVQLTTRLEHTKYKNTGEYHHGYVKVKRVIEFELSDTVKAQQLYREGFDAEARLQRELGEL